MDGLAFDQGQPPKRLSAEEQEQDRCEKGVEQRRRNESAKYGHGNGAKNLLSRLIGADHQWHQRNTGGERRHQLGSEALKRATHDHLAAKLLALKQNEVDVVPDLEDAIPRRGLGKNSPRFAIKEMKRLCGDRSGALSV